MYATLCSIIKSNLGEDSLFPLVQNLGDDELYDFVQNIFCADNVADLIECLVGSENEDVYWFLWDNLMHAVEDLNNPGIATGKMIERFREEHNNWKATAFHATHPVTTERLILSPMDVNSANELAEAVETEGEDKNFIGSFQSFANTGRLYFKIERIDTNDLVGYVGLCLVKSWGGAASDHTYNIEYYVTPQNRRKGYLTEAAKKMLELARDGKIRALNDIHHQYVIEEFFPAIKMVKLMCGETNMASQKCALALGFEQEGILSFVRDKDVYREYVFSKSFC